MRISSTISVAASSLFLGALSDQPTSTSTVALLQLSDLVGILSQDAVHLLPCRHSGPQGKVKPLTIIDDPADWKAADWQGREDEYTYTFSQADTEELLAAVEAVKAKGVATEDDVLAVSASASGLMAVDAVSARSP